MVTIKRLPSQQHQSTQYGPLVQLPIFWICLIKVDNKQSADTGKIKVIRPAKNIGLIGSGSSTVCHCGGSESIGGAGRESPKAALKT